MSELRAYWKYLVSVAAAPDDVFPFDKLSTATAAKPAKADERRPFSAADVLKLLAEAKRIKDKSLADLIELGRWTGARIGELCALKIDKVNLRAGYIEIEDAKTTAGWRQVPIHSKLKPTMTRLLKASDDGYALSGLTVNKYGDRSNASGKRFGRIRTDLGFGAQHVFHSIRNASRDAARGCRRA